jgi:tetratricopeptide (TPR) repeat protein
VTNHRMHDDAKHAGRSVTVTGDVKGSSIFTGDVIQTPPAPTALRQLRAPVGDFVGRKQEIETLIYALRPKNRACIVGISGMGGIGKTELALLVAGRLTDDYPDAQFSINLQGTDAKPLLPEQVMAMCIRAFLGPKATLFEDLAQLSQQYLSQLSGKRVLLLLDNAVDSDQVRPLLPPPGSALLVTSRQAIILPGMTSLTLDPLTDKEAQALLLEIVSRAAPAAQQICALCGYLPLAIRAAGSLLAITADLDPVDYAEELKDERKRLERIGTKGVNIGVEASFNLSYARLEPEAARVFRLLSMFPATFDAAAEEVVCEDMGHVHLSNLVQRHMVLYDSRTKRYRLHDLVRLFAYPKLSDEERGAAQQRHATYYKDVLVVADEQHSLKGPDLNELKPALERVIEGTASEDDRNAVRSALTTGVLVTGERAVAIGGNASDVVITTGDQNLIFSLRDSDAATVRDTLISIAPTQLHQVPPPPADFTGREHEQRELLTAVERGNATIFGLQGMGGIGKTALAFKLVEQLKPRYPDAQLYLDLKGFSDQPLTAAEALAHIIRSYHPAAKLPNNEMELRGLYLSVLDGQRAILLMDNAASAEQVEPLIPPASCVLLVTSRWHFTLPGLAAKNLDTMTAADARWLLLAIAPQIGEWADEIAALCGYLPLALRLAAGALARYRDLKPADYVRRFHDRQQRVQLFEASFGLSYELLSEGLRKYWRRLAVFPDSFAHDAAAAVWEVEVDQAQHTLGMLMAASMVEWNESTNRYLLYDPARLFADSKLEDGERVVAHKRHATHYIEVLAAANKLYLEGGDALLRGLALLDLEWTNIEAGHAWVASQGVETDEDIAQLSMAFPNAGAFVLNLRQHSRERISWLEIALTAARRLQHRKYEGAALGNLGIAYAELGETQRAIQFYEQQLPIIHELGDRRGEGAALGNLGIAYAELGETQRAIQFYERALLIDRETGDRRAEGNELGNIGTAYRELGEIRQAIQFLDQHLTIAREIGDRRGEGIALGNIGTAYRDLGDIRQALQFYEEQLTVVHEIGDRRGEGNALWNISLALDQLGQRAQAIQHAEQALVIFEQIESPNAAKVRAQLAAWREEMATINQ